MLVRFSYGSPTLHLLPVISFYVIPEFPGNNGLLLIFPRESAKKMNFGGTMSEMLGDGDTFSLALKRIKLGSGGAEIDVFLAPDAIADLRIISLQKFGPLFGADKSEKRMAVVGTRLK